MPGPTDDPARAYAAGTIAVLSSISEGFPYGALEPMACGRPLVATHVGGVPEVVGDAGLLVHARDPDALAGACVRLLRDRGLRDRLRVVGRRRVVQDFSLEHMVEGFQSRYADVVAGVRVAQPVRIPQPRSHFVGVGDRVTPYLPPRRDPEWAYALIRAKAGG
jgi:glycosyltransferase involved in cell wall biosynthesis